MTYFCPCQLFQNGGKALTKFKLYKIYKIINSLPMMTCEIILQKSLKHFLNERLPKWKQYLQNRQNNKILHSQKLKFSVTNATLDSDTNLEHLGIIFAPLLSPTLLKQCPHFSREIMLQNIQYGCNSTWHHYRFINEIIMPDQLGKYCLVT